MEFGNNGFEERGRMEYPKKNLSEQRREPAKNSAIHLHQCQDLNMGQIGALEGKKRQMLHCNRIINTGIYDWLNEQDAVDL